MSNDVVRILACIIVLYTIYILEQRNGLRVCLQKATLNLSNSLNRLRQR